MFLLIVISVFCVGLGVFHLPHLKYYFRLGTFISISILFCVISIPVMLLNPRNYKNALTPAKMCLKTANLMGFTFDVFDKDLIIQNSSGVVLINHQSILDMAVLAALWPLLGQAAVVAKKELMFLFPFSWAIYLWGTIFIDRKNTKNAHHTLDEQSKEILKNHQKKLIFFPEGTRNEQKLLLPFKKGPFHLAIETQSPIQPIVVSHYHFLNCRKRTVKSGRALIKILPEISTKGLTIKDLPILLQSVQKTMQEEYDKASDESVQKEAHLFGN